MTKQFVCRNVDSNGYEIPDSGCGIIPHVIFDGYSFGDRQLEGVMFKAFLKKGKIAVDSVDVWDECPYLITLNKRHWMPLAR